MPAYLIYHARKHDGVHVNPSFFPEVTLLLEVEDTPETNVNAIIEAGRHFDIVDATFYGSLRLVD